MSRNEPNVFEGTFSSNTGVTRVSIDRENKEKQKSLILSTETFAYTLTPGILTETDLKTRITKIMVKSEKELLTHELDIFFAESKKGCEGNKKRRAIDLSIAAALSHLPPARVLEMGV